MSLNRRRAIQSLGLLSAVPLLSVRHVRADEPAPVKLAVKYGMIGGEYAGKSIEEKFLLLKKIGFAGVELDSPMKINRDEVIAARDKTGIIVHGVVDSVHWKDTLSSPSEEVRARGLAALHTAIDDCKFYGGDTVLLVPGVVNKEVSYEQAYERSQAEIRKAIPAAKAAGVKIAIEVVWNNFLTTPEQLIQFVDDLKSETVGAYFDCSNMLKYGVPATEWIRKLGKRMFKFDFKGYHIPTQKWVAIGEGSEDWPKVRKALREIGYNGWATSEVGGGGEEHLRKIYDRMHKALLA